jgi:thiol-disulfide isomerase/thioredoxin
MKIKFLTILFVASLFLAPVALHAQSKRAPKGKKPPAAPAAGTPAKKTAAPAKESAPAIPIKYIGPEELRGLLTRAPGDKPLLVNFWATWCEPCIEEFPDLVKIDADYKARLDFITISLDEKTELTKGVPKFLGKMKSTMPAYQLNLDEQEAAFNAVDKQWSGALPLTMLYDGNGKVVFKRTGKLNIAELRAELDKLVSGKQ